MTSDQARDAEDQDLAEVDGSVGTDPSADEAPPVPSSPSRRGSLRRAAMVTAAVGIVFAVLFILTFLIVATVPDDAVVVVAGDDAALTRRLAVAGLYIMPFAGIAFIWFVVSLRTWIAASAVGIDILISSVQLVSGIVFVAMFFAAGACWAAIPAAVEIEGEPVPALVSELPKLGDTLLFVFGMRMAAMFIFTTSTLAMKHRILPRWFIWLGYAIGLFLLLSVSFAEWLVMVFPAWTLVLSILLMQRARAIPPEIRIGEAAPRRRGRAIS
jgi:hypothetical protein